MLEPLNNLIMKDGGARSASVMTGGGNQWTDAVVSAADEIGVLCAEKKAPNVQRIIPWSNVRGISWVEE